MSSWAKQLIRVTFFLFVSDIFLMKIFADSKEEALLISSSAFTLSLLDKAFGQKALLWMINYRVNAEQLASSTETFTRSYVSSEFQSEKSYSKNR